MASPSQITKTDKKDKKIMNPTNVAEQEEVDQDSSQELPENTFKVTRTVKDANGERKASATYHLPIAKTLADADKFSGSDDQELVYWYNLGRKVAARQQVFMALNNQFADEKINELNKAFVEAVDQMLAGKEDAAKRKRYTEYILGEEQYAPLVQAMKDRDTNKSIPHFDFGTQEIKKPGDKPGRPAGTK
jgi:hypothetical protein